MSRTVQIVLLCEDRQQQAFMRRFLERSGKDCRLLRTETAPRGEGSAEQFVRKRFAREVAEHRSRSVSQALMVMIDGDARGVDRRLAELDDECKRQSMSVRTPDEGVLVFVPTWNIETWLAYLDGETVDEEKPDYPRLSRPKDCGSHVAALAEMCHRRRLREPAPPALIAACVEYRRWSAARNR